MRLFHYHFWTDRLEETEHFYKELGFEVIYRFGKDQNYHPPLTWEEFRSEDPVLRVVEMRKGFVNITFGHGKRPMFDHIGYLVTEDERNAIIERAQMKGWNTEVNERRSFIRTPFGFRIELQCRNEVVETTDKLSILSMEIGVKKTKGIDQLTDIFSSNREELSFTESESLHLQKVTFARSLPPTVDPNGVKIVSSIK